MPKSICDYCGSTYLWQWDDAFDKFGFGDGDAEVKTATVVMVLRRGGYVVEHMRWGLHNDIIISIHKDGIDQIPSTAHVGYDAPRDYLPPDIITLLDAYLPDEGEERL